MRLMRITGYKNMLKEAKRKSYYFSFNLLAISVAVAL